MLLCKDNLLILYSLNCNAIPCSPGPLFRITGRRHQKTLMTQVPSSLIMGEYYLTGVPEMASAFRLSADHTFQFFMVCGALERYGSGRWRQQGSRVVLQSAPWPGSDFRLNAMKEVNEQKVVIRISCPANKALERYVHASLDKADSESWQPADEDGFILFAARPVDELGLLFEFCPERISLFVPENKKANYFEFEFQPWLGEYFFDNFELDWSGEELRGGHPVMQEGEFFYKKNG